jgi:hypothetical protein
MFGFAGSYVPDGSSLAEVVVVNGYMTDAEIASLKTYLKNKWGL